MIIATVCLCATYAVLAQAVSCSQLGRCDCDPIRSNNNGNSSLENVALWKTAKVNGADAAGSGRYNLPVSVAVNGVKDDDDCCVESNRGDYTPSLTVDLGQTYNISFITIYRRNTWESRMVGLAIFVDDELCDVIDKEEAKGDNSSLPGNVTKPPVPITIYCETSPVLGSVVTLVKNTTRRYYWTFPYIINICEIEVWATTSTTKSTLRTGQLTTSSADVVTATDTTATTPTTKSTLRTGQLTTSSAGVVTATDTTAITPTTKSTLRTGQLTTSSAGVVTATDTTETENGFFPYITGGSVGGGLLIIFLIVAISIWTWRKIRQTSDSPEESPNTANANGSVMAKDSTGEENNGDAASEENPYDTLDPTDINEHVYSIYTPTPVAYTLALQPNIVYS